ncbi:MAG: hypothetical protein P4L84_37325 [Isosphaeraceae bacterium]|nr:hypothetical protein [Isosphaeraceae bacterium]
MALGWIGALGLVALALPGPADSPVAWSPDGEWMAYTVKVREPWHGLPKRWFFQTESLNDETPAAVGEEGPAATFRLWATRVDSSDSLLLDGGRSVLSAPCWSADGKVLAFTRVVADGKDRTRYEVVLQDEPDRQRVILSRPLTGREGNLEGLSALSPAWSPDGRLLAVALPQQTLDLAVLRADNGRVLKVFQDSTRPAWSPDAKNVALAFVRGREPQSLQWVDGSFGAPRTLVELGQTTQTPFWLDAGSLAVVAHTSGRKGMAPPSDQFSLIRVSLETGAVQVVVSLNGNPGEARGVPRGTSFSFDRDRENLFFTRAALSPPYEIVWSRPRHNEILKPFAPFDFTIACGALAVAPRNRLLAFRAGGLGSEALPAVVDLSDDHLAPTALVPDDEVRVQWVVNLIRTARRLLFVSLPPAKLKQGLEVERASILPLAGEIAPQQEMLARLRKLGRAGRPICERPAGASPAEPAVQELLEEGRLFFDYLRQDYDAALASLDAWEARVTDSDSRLRLLSVRAQIYVAQGRAEQARETIEYLRGCDRGQAGSIEDTPLGPELRTVPDPGRSWPQYLSERSEAYLRAVQKPLAEEENPANPFGNRNLDAAEGALFEAPLVPRRPRAFPFVPPGQVPRLEAGPDLVLPPGGMIAPPPQPPAPPRAPRGGVR